MGIIYLYSQMSSSMTDTAMASYRAKVGNRYFKVDEGYDKRVYENDARNYARIVATFILFYIFVFFFWWGTFEFATNYTETFTMYSIYIFIIGVAFICCMLLSGKIANEKKRRHIFLEERIAELSAARAEDEKRRNQELLYQAKLAKKNETRS